MPAYKDKKTGKWFYQINYKDINGDYKQKRKSGFKTKKAAQDAEYLANVDMNISVDSHINFKELADHYFSYVESRIKYSSYYSKKNLTDLHIIPFFGNMRANNITSKHIISWQEEMKSKGYSFEYLSKIYVNLSAILNHGVKHHGLKDNPCKIVGNFKNPTEVEEHVSFWTQEEFNKFIFVVDDIRFSAYFSFLYYTGARKSEALALQWKDIDLNKKEVNIYKSITKKEKKEGGISIGSPKTKSSYRRILLPDILVNQLNNYYKWCERFEGFNDEVLVFGMNKPFSSSSIYKEFTRFIKAANVKKIKVHDLRHSHASLLINQGASILIVAKRLGHKDINETLNTYSHMFPSKEKEVIELINNLVQ